MRALPFHAPQLPTALAPTQVYLLKVRDWHRLGQMRKVAVNELPRAVGEI